MTSSSRRALVVQNSLSPFGNKLVASGYVNSDQMQQALVESRRSGRSLAQVLHDMTGQPLPPDLLRQYKKQQLFELKILYGIESLDPEISKIPTDNVNHLIDTLISQKVCREHYILPLLKSETEPLTVTVAMVNPEDLLAQDELKRELQKVGNPIVNRLVITKEDFLEIFNRYLKELEAKEQKRVSDKLVDVGSDLANLDDLGLELAEEEAELSASANEGNAAPIVSLVNKILIKALQEGVSDIHIEPQEESLRVRFRKDGVLQQAFPPFPKNIVAAVTARFKILASLDIAERRQPQDGRIRQKFQGKKVDFRVNTLPSRFGEKVCMRILSSESTQLGLDKLISDPEALAKVRDMSSRPFGLILVSGPTGSGKSTTLYSMLAERNDPGVNISTAEDPIEYSLPGITQVQVIREKNMDFASILRAFMRQDPDIILVGETRDLETAKTAIEASLTGHLVLTTIHANDAASSITRLDEMGVEPFMVSASLIGVCAQRLMRRVCSECRIPYQPTPEELARFGLSASRTGTVTFYKANSLTPDEIQAARARGNLCPKCSGIGYKGRCGVYEVMQVTERIQNAINQRATADRIKEIAVEDGMTTLLAYSLKLVQEGATTLEEVERVTFTDTGLEAELKAKRKSSLTCRVCKAELKPEWYDCPYCTTPRFQD